MPELTTPADFARVLRSARTIAVLGAHPERWRPASYVPQYLHEQGYDVIAVNPRFVGQTLWGNPVVASLDEIEVPIDLVDVFRRSDAVAGHLDEILALDPRPTVVWLQQGVRDDDVARQLVAAGIDVVQDRCTMAEHRRL